MPQVALSLSEIEIMPIDYEIIQDNFGAAVVVKETHPMAVYYKSHDYTDVGTIYLASTECKNYSGNIINERFDLFSDFNYEYIFSILTRFIREKILQVYDNQNNDQDKIVCFFDIDYIQEFEILRNATEHNIPYSINDFVIHDWTTTLDFTLVFYNESGNKVIGRTPFFNSIYPKSQVWERIKGFIIFILLLTIIVLNIRLCTRTEVIEKKVKEISISETESETDEIFPGGLE